MALPPGIELHRGRFRARKWVNGKRVRRSFDCLEEAVSFLAMLEADVRDEKSVEAARISGIATVREVVDLWWLGPIVNGEHQGGHRLRVGLKRQRDVDYYIEAYISRIGSESAQSYARNTALLKLFYDSLPKRMAQHCHSVLNMSFRQAVTRGLMDRNPCEVEKAAKYKKRRRDIPTRDEVDKILIAAEEQDSRWGLFVYLTATLATRCCETVAFRYEDFDEDRKVVHVDRGLTKTKGRPTIKDTKYGGSRDLPMDDPDFWDHISPMLNGEGYLFTGFYRDGPRKGPDAEEKPWHPDHAEKRFLKMRRAIGLREGYTLHSLRHFWATQMLIAGMPINQVAEFLGHSPQMTLNLYGRHLDEEAMRRVGRAATRLVPRPDRRPVVADQQSGNATSPPKPPAAAVAQGVADDIVLALAHNGPVTNAMVRAETALTRRQVSKALDRLVKKGQLERHGTKKGTHYRSKLSPVKGQR